VSTRGVNEGYGMMSRGERAAQTAAETRAKNRKLGCGNWCGIRKSFRLKKIYQVGDGAGDFDGQTA
jgi:hypothetical protein